MSILDHVWGESLAADRVWAQVAGMSPTRSATRAFMVLQAFMDESVAKGGHFVIGGHVANVETWATFVAAWEELLPKYGLRDERGFYFHMAEMWNKKRENIEHFYRAIESHLPLSISCSVRIPDIENAKGRIKVSANLPEALRRPLPTPTGRRIFDLGLYANHYVCAFRGLIDNFHYERFNKPVINEIIGEEKVDFYFDIRREKRAIQNGWDGYVELQPQEIRKYLGSEPRFEDDREFVALQSADLWAWAIRRWMECLPPFDGNIGDFGIFKKQSKVPKLMHVSMTEETLAHVFRGEAMYRCSGAVITDVRFGVLPGQAFQKLF